MNTHETLRQGPRGVFGHMSLADAMILAKHLDTHAEAWKDEVEESYNTGYAEGRMAEKRRWESVYGKWPGVPHVSREARMTTYTPNTLRDVAQAMRDGTMPNSGTIEVHADAWKARETELVEALKRIADHSHCAYSGGTMYDIGVADGHKCAAEIARAAIKKAEPGRCSYCGVGPGEIHGITCPSLPEGMFGSLAPEISTMKQPYDDSQDFPMPDISDGDPMNDPSVR